MSAEPIYLDTYALQQDMRVRMPKSILTNMDAKKGVTKFDIFLDANNEALILKKHENESSSDSEI